MNLIEEIKKKREFSMLPDSVVERILNDVEEKGGDKGDGLLDSEKVKETRAVLRKYFGVFLTNKVVKPKDLMDFDSVLKSHKSSAKRNYAEFYEKIHDGLGKARVGSVIDLGCGMNGFSYSYLEKAFGGDAQSAVHSQRSTVNGSQSSSGLRYVGVEAAGQVVDNTNVFFDRSGVGDKCEIVHGDLFDVKFVKGILKSEGASGAVDGRPLTVNGKLLRGNARVVFMFQVVDALESMKRNFSKEFLLMVKKNAEYVVVSMPCVSLSGKMMKVKRNWVVDFLEENFEVMSEFEEDMEKIICLKC